MQKENTRSFPEDESLTHHPFRVPEGYFENFAGRLQQRIREEEEARVPVRRLWSSTRFRAALAAALVLLALVSYSLIRMISPGEEPLSNFSDLVLLEEMYAIDNDLYYIELMENGTETTDEEDIYLEQAMDYLALNDVEMDLISESE